METKEEKPFVASPRSSQAKEKTSEIVITPPTSTKVVVESNAAAPTVASTETAPVRRRDSLKAEIAKGETLEFVGKLPLWVI